MRQVSGLERVRLGQMDLEEHLRDPRIRQRYVTALFDTIADRYDRFTKWFSYGMDSNWKREILGRVASQLTCETVVLDLACGTGDLSLGIAELEPEALIVGVDHSARMVALAEHQRQVAGRKGVSFSRADMMQLPIATSSADFVVVGYGLRNVPNCSSALEDIGRVLKVGGCLLTLDFYRPSNKLWCRLFLEYLRVVGNAYGWAWHRQPEAYGYIAKSVQQYLTLYEFTTLLEQQGFSVRAVLPKLWGGICVHIAVRLPDGHGPENSNDENV